MRFFALLVLFFLQVQQEIVKSEGVILVVPLCLFPARLFVVCPTDSGKRSSIQYVAMLRGSGTHQDLLCSTTVCMLVLHDGCTSAHLSYYVHACTHTCTHTTHTHARMHIHMHAQGKPAAGQVPGGPCSPYTPALPAPASTTAAAAAAAAAAATATPAAEQRPWQQHHNPSPPRSPSRAASSSSNSSTYSRSSSTSNSR